MGSIDDFLAGRKLAISPPLVLPGREKPVFVRELAGLERAEMDKQRYKPDGKGGTVWDRERDNIHWTVACACQSDGTRIFHINWDKPAEIGAAIKQAGSLPFAELRAIAIAAVKVNPIPAACCWPMKARILPL